MATEIDEGVESSVYPHPSDRSGMKSGWVVREESEAPLILINENGVVIRQGCKVTIFGVRGGMTVDVCAMLEGCNQMGAS